MAAGNPGDARVDRVRRVVDGALWSTYSRVYDGLLGFWPYRNLLQQTVRELDLDRARSLLDVGCGTGNLLLCVQRVAPDVRATGVDASPSMLRQARRKLAAHGGGVELVDADAVAHLATVPSGSVDRIAAVNVLYALDDRARFWREVRRALAPGGVAVVTTSTRGGSASIIREHLDHERWSTLVRPRLVAVFVVDALISLLARASHFEFPPDETLVAEAESNGMKVLRTARAYGGVNLLITATTT
jgi:ubiquinone/menaquinone biosynthesis C-methylase UbiE